MTIGKWDIELLKKWLKLAEKEGTDQIKVHLDQSRGDSGWVKYIVEVHT